MKQIITLFAFFIMMWNANAQTCEIGRSDFTVNTGTVFAQTWVDGTTSGGNIYGVQRTVNKNGLLTKVGIILGRGASNLKAAIYSDNSNTPNTLLTPQFPGVQVMGGSPTNKVDTVYVSLGDTIPVTVGEKYWACIKFNANNNYNVLNNLMTSQSGFLKFKTGNLFVSAIPSTLVVTPTVGQYAIFLVIEDCTDPMPVTIANGNASNAATWLGGNIPSDGDSVIVQHEVNWDIDMQTDGDTYAWMLIKDSLTMTFGSWIKTKVLVDSLGNNFAGRVVIDNPGNNVSIDGAGTSSFEDLLILGDTLFCEKPVEVFLLRLESDIHVVTTNLSMQGKSNIPSSIYWDDTLVDVTFSGTVPIVDRFSIINPPGEAPGTWRIEGGPGTGETIGDWDASPGHSSTGYPDADYPGVNFMSPSFYDETNPSINKDIGWEFPTGDAHSLDSAGFFAYYNAGSYETSWNPTLVVDTFTFSGLTNTSSGNVAADGWILLRNPFACAVDIEDFILTGVEQKVWTWDHLAVTYDDYNITTNIGTSGRTSEIATGQAFWVKVLSGQTGSVSIPPSAMIKTSTLQYRDDEEEPIELILTAEDGTSYNAFVIPSETGEMVYEEDNDVLTLNSNSDLGNVTICTTSSDGMHLSQNAVPNNQTIIVDVYGSTPTPNGENMFTVSVSALYEDWCISIDWAGGAEEWIPVTNGEELVVPVSIAQSTQTNFARLRFAPDINFDITGPEDGIIVWEPGQESVDVTFTANGSFEALDWFMDSEITSFGNTEEVTYSFTEPGIYTVSAWSSNTCGVDAETFVVFIECAPMSLTYVSPEVTEMVVVEGTDMVAVEFEISAENHESITWEFEDGTVVDGSNQTTVIHEFTTFGTQTVLVTITNDCSSQTLPFTIVFEQIIGVNEEENEMFSIFPNPSDGNTINLSGISDGKALVEIYDSTGKLIHRSSETILGTTIISFDNKLPTGVYFVRIDESSTKVVVR